MRCRSRDWIELRIGNDSPAFQENTAGLHRVFKVVKGIRQFLRGHRGSVGPPFRWERVSNSTSFLRSVTLSPAILYDLSLKGRCAATNFFLRDGKTFKVGQLGSSNPCLPN